MPRSNSTEEIIIVRRCKAPRDLVWQVWTDPRHVEKWWGPFGPDGTSSDIDLRIGGTYYVGLRAPDGTEHPSRGVISELAPLEKIVMTGDPDARDACGAGLPPKAVVTIRFEDDSLGTKVTLKAVFESEAARIAAQDHNFLVSWTATFETLDVYYAQLLDTQDEPGQAGI